MFSLGGSTVQDGKVVGSVTQRNADEAIGGAIRGIERGIQGVSIHVCHSFANLPADVLAEAASQKVTAAKGVFSSGRVFVVLDAHSTTQEH